MYAVNVKGVSKSYGSKTVVDRVSFQVAAGEILGLIGPNGAGKTTCIRMIMDVIKPDSGEVLIFERPFRNELKNEIGYLPEERGLYRKKPIIESMVYLAALKGMDREQASHRAEEWLNRVNMQAHKNKKIEELSHGIAQIIQFLVTILHGPRVIILDEPFTGLDPVNVKTVKDIILEQKQQGKAIMLSTHRINEVEELCDRVFMINKGQNVLYGSIEEVKAKYRNNSVVVDFEGELGELSGVLVNRLNGHSVEITLGENTTRQQLLERLVSRRVVLNKFEASTPSLNEIFIRVVGGQK
jgi:ABC-2 type transport system ATP-binding protein